MWWLSLFGCATPAAEVAEACVPLECPVTATCGPVADGCGGTLDCGVCEDPAVCTEENTCEVPCTPVVAVFFDLGETLVTENADGLFDTRPEALTVLAALRAKGVATGVITNVPRGYTLDDVRPLLVDPTVLDQVDVILLSSQATARPKPDPALFAEAVALLPGPPAIGQTAFVTEDLGDLANADPPTKGAQAAGMIGVHLSDDAPSPLVDRTVTVAGLATLAAAPWLECLEAP